MGAGHHSKWTWVTDSVRGEIKSAQMLDFEKIAERKFLLDVGPSW